MHGSNWYVISGAPSSGKTAVIEELKRRGYHVVPEVARALIDRGLAQGKTLARIKANIQAFERAILKEKVRIESELHIADVVFFDRAIPDSIAYYLLEGLDPEEARTECHRVRYKRVFLFERLKYFKDAVRRENDHLAHRLDGLLADSYKDIGYRVLRVPVMTVAARTDWILDRL